MQEKLGFESMCTNAIWCPLASSLDVYAYKCLCVNSCASITRKYFRFNVLLLDQLMSWQDVSLFSMFNPIWMSQFLQPVLIQATVWLKKKTAHFLSSEDEHAMESCHTSSISHWVTDCTPGCFTTSLMTPPSPPPITSTCKAQTQSKLLLWGITCIILKY